MMWRLVDSVYLRLGDEFEKILKNFFITLEGYWIPISRDELCVQLMREKYFAAPLSRIYVDSLFNGNSKKIVKKNTAIFGGAVNLFLVGAFLKRSVYAARDCKRSKILHDFNLLVDQLILDYLPPRNSATR